MNKIRTKLFLIYSSIFSLLLAGLVTAQTRLSDAVKDIQMLDIAKTYATIPSLIDFLLLYALFLHIFREVLKKREFPKPVATVLAIIAALGGVIGLNQLNTNLILFARPVMYLALAFLIIKNFGTENKSFNAGLGFLIAYKIMEMLEKTAPSVADFPFFALLKGVFMFAGFILMGIGIGQIVSGAFGGLGRGEKEGKDPTGPSGKTKKEREKRDKEPKNQIPPEAIIGAQNILKDLFQKVGLFGQLVNESSKKIKQEIQEYTTYINSMPQVKNELEKYRKELDNVEIDQSGRVSAKGIAILRGLNEYFDKKKIAANSDSISKFITTEAYLNQSLTKINEELVNIKQKKDQDLEYIDKRFKQLDREWHFTSGDPQINQMIEKIHQDIRDIQDKDIKILRRLELRASRKEFLYIIKQQEKLTDELTPLQGIIDVTSKKLNTLMSESENPQPNNVGEMKKNLTTVKSGVKNTSNYIKRHLDEYKKIEQQLEVINQSVIPAEASEIQEIQNKVSQLNTELQNLAGMLVNQPQSTSAQT